METLDNNVAEVLGLPLEKVSPPKQRARPQKPARWLPAATLMLAVAGGVVGVTYMLHKPLQASQEARVAPAPKQRLSPSDPAPAPADTSLAAEPRQASADAASLTQAAPRSTEPLSSPPAPPAPPDAATLRRLRAERLIEERVTPLASKADMLRLARAERPIINSAVPRFDLDPPARLSEPSWVGGPSEIDVERAYPKEALLAGIGGSVTLGCRERVDGSVDRCEVLSETPEDEGFGRAALRLSRSFRFTPFTVDGAAIEVGVQIPYDFAVKD